MIGAFKANPTRQLETEAYVTLLDIWPNGRIARFQARLEQAGQARQIKDACAAIRTKLRIRRRQAPDTPAAARKQWVEKRIEQPIEKSQSKRQTLVPRDNELRRQTSATDN